MKSRLCIGAILAATIFFSSLGGAETRAFGPRGGFWQGSGPNFYPGIPAPYSGGGYFTYPIGPGYTPYVLPYAFPPTYTLYVAPYPAYGILPPPFAAARIYDSWYNQSTTTGRTASGSGMSPSKRLSLYPDVPPEKSAEDRRRVRFEIGVPYENAEVYINGAKTKQSGLNRIYFTPPMEEEKEYTSTIKVQWPKAGGEMSEPRQKTFSIVAGQTIQYQFKE